MDPRLIVPLPPESPWSAWTRPDIKHCEANLAGWIAAPADAWSNLAYFAVGAWLVARHPRGHGRALGLIALAAGACSFAFHASYTAAGQALDYLGMFLLTGWLIARALTRAGWTKNEGAARAAVVAASAAVYAAFWLRHVPVQTVMLSHVAVLLVLEARLAVLETTPRPRGPLWAALGLVAAASACWQLDHADAFCRPDEHRFQWHAAWHVLTAAAFIPLARFHAVLE